VGILTLPKDHSTGRVREMAKRGGRKSTERQTEASEYRHTQADSPLRPDVGTQAQFRKKGCTGFRVG